ncbi:hypothetical protein HIM_01430 [Hirsutella minnesotensis 3608]|nr:hypothetical protein HIM_01430 [Hirsutella minnesotensis 3608]
MLSSWILVLGWCFGCHAADRAAPVAPTITQAPIFLPFYHEESWSVMRGSILSSNKTASETTYTIFCPVQTPPACDLSLEFPFIIVEGPGTLRFHGTVTSSLTADVECKLSGTTAAACSGYSSFKSGYANGQFSGATEMTWTSTLTGNEVEWGTLTMAEKPRTTDNHFGVTGGGNTAPTVASSDLVPPAATSPGVGASVRLDERLAMMTILAVVAILPW